MNLVIINPQLMRQLRLFRHDVLDLANLISVQQTVLGTDSQAQGFVYGVEISGDGDERWVASICCINLSVSCENRVAAAPAEADCADFTGSWCLTDGFNKRVDERFCDALSVLC